MTFDISIMCRYIVIFIDATILLTCLNFDIDIKLTTVCIKLLKCRYIFGILHITTYNTDLQHLVSSSIPDVTLYRNTTNNKMQM